MGLYPTMLDYFYIDSKTPKGGEIGRRLAQVYVSSEAIAALCKTDHEGLWWRTKEGIPQDAELVRIVQDTTPGKDGFLLTFSHPSFYLCTPGATMQTPTIKMEMKVEDPELMKAIKKCVEAIPRYVTPRLFADHPPLDTTSFEEMMEPTKLNQPTDVLSDDALSSVTGKGSMDEMVDAAIKQPGGAFEKIPHKPMSGALRAFLAAPGETFGGEQHTSDPDAPHIVDAT